MPKSIREVMPGEVFRVVSRTKGEPCLMLKDRTIVRLSSLDTHQHPEEASLLRVEVVGNIQTPLALGFALVTRA